MLSNSLIKYFKGLNERSNQISTLLFINTISSLGITLSFTANNILVDSIFFTLLIVHSMCLTITLNLILQKSKRDQILLIM